MIETAAPLLMFGINPRDPRVPPAPVAPRTGALVYVGPAAEEVAFPRTVPAAAFEIAKDSAGVVLEFATDVVNSGERLPAEKEVTVPLLLDPFAAAVTRPFAFTVMFAFVNEPTLLFTVASVSALELEVVASPLISAAVKAEESPRTRPVNVLPVPVPPLATGTTENVVVGGFPAPPPKTNCPEASAAEEAHVVAPEK